MIIHSCDLPKARESFYNVYKCPVCKQWWVIRLNESILPRPYWDCTSRISLMFTGYGSQCRSFLRRNRRWKR